MGPVRLAVDGRSDDQGVSGWGERIGPDPTDRGKSGVKRSLLTDGAEVPLGVVVAPANKLDFQLARETLESVPIERPTASEESPQGMCMDKGYDDSEVEALLKEFSDTAPSEHEVRRGSCSRSQASERGGGSWSGHTVGWPADPIFGTSG